MQKIWSMVISKSDCRSSGNKSESQLCHITFIEINQEIISPVILLFHWVKKGVFQLLAKVCAQVLLNHSEDKAWPGKVSRLNDQLNMTLTLLTGL